MNENDTTYSYLATKASLYMPSHPPLPFTSTELERLGFAYGLVLAAGVIRNVCAILVLIDIPLALVAVATNWYVLASASLVIALISLLLILLSMQMKVVGDSSGESW